MNCLKCGKEGSGKFCNECGAKMIFTCASCGAVVTGRFCVSCGKSMDPPGSQLAKPSSNNTSHRGYIYWNVQPGQIAVKMPIDSLKPIANAKGVIIQAGTRALVYNTGEFIGELSGGSYDFGEALPEPVQKAVTAEFGEAVRSFIIRICAKIKRWGTSAAAGQNRDDLTEMMNMVSAVGDGKNIMIVLARDGDFPVQFELSDMPTAGIRSLVVVKLRMGITELNAFQRDYLTDRNHLSIADLENELRSRINEAARMTLKGVPLDKLEGDTALKQQLLDALSADESLASSVRVRQVVSLTGSNEKLGEVRESEEALFIEDRKLDVRTRCSEFANRMRIQETREKLDQAKSDVDRRKLLIEVNKDELLADDELENFMMLLKGQRLVREARNDDEIKAALVMVETSGLLREEELTVFREELEGRAFDRRSERAHDVEIRETRRQHERNLEKQRISEQDQDYQDDRAHIRQRMEFQRYHELDMLQFAQTIGRYEADLKFREDIAPRERALELQRLRDELAFSIESEELAIERERRRDTYSDERRKRERDEIKTQRLDDLEIGRKEQQDQLDVLRQAEEIRRAREQDNHNRMLETARLRQDHERQLMRERVERFKGMSVEEIIAANPDLTEAQALAISEKAKAQASAMAGEEKARLMESQQEKMMEFVKEMARTNAGIAVGRSSDREKEINRLRDSADKESSRAVDLVNKTVSAMTRGKDSPSKRPGKIDSAGTTVRACPSCNAEIPLDSVFCQECGARRE
jgi:hypothetical protein